ncbi:uncharacterized protein LOC125679398 isoform X2 [Ostrea edulis]|uniref:uncharacterized protein LOC125679398 isoform X2 n=1 Tax=Ostrea edulis TaxID=37623 RepID=UPI0024AFB10D|nr:uncharacterized protein LOC125679398 isoform X2 [Ostrea edulis]
MMKFCFFIFCASTFLLSDAEQPSIQTLTFPDHRCYGPFYSTPRESFKVNHTSEELGYICKDMSFSGWDQVESVEREVCVRVQQLSLYCSQKLEYRTGSRRSRPAKSYDCYDTAKDIPVFCTFDLLYIRVQSEKENDYSKVVYTVFSGKGKPSYKADSGNMSSLVPAIGAVLLLLLIISIVCFIRAKRARQMQMEAVVTRRNQQPPANIHHHYHQGDQGATSHLNQGHFQGQPLLPQGYNMPPQAPPQFQVYPQYPSGQQMIPNYPPLNVQEPINDMSGPPSYEEVTNQKR